MDGLRPNRDLGARALANGPNFNEKEAGLSTSVSAMATPTIPRNGAIGVSITETRHQNGMCCLDVSGALIVSPLPHSKNKNSPIRNAVVARPRMGSQRGRSRVTSAITPAATPCTTHASNTRELARATPGSSVLMERLPGLSTNVSLIQPSSSESSAKAGIIAASFPDTIRPDPTKISLSIANIMISTYANPATFAAISCDVLVILAVILFVFVFSSFFSFVYSTSITTFPVFWPLSTYRCPSAIFSKEYCLSMTDFIFPCSISSLRKSKSSFL